jgi:hypothetical protein
MSGHIVGHFEPGDLPWEIAHVGTIEVGAHHDLVLRDWGFVDPHAEASGKDRVLRGRMHFPDALYGHTVGELHRLAHGAGCTCPVALWQPRDRPTNPAGTPAPAATPRNGDSTMTTTTGAVTPLRHGAPDRWGAAIDDTADFDPENDTALLEHLSEEVAGLLGHGESLTELHETCVNGVRVDPAAMECVNDCADAVAEAAGVMAQAINRFKEVLEAPREFVADGGVLPKDGDWITGEDEA